MKYAPLIRSSPLAAILLLAACDQHTPVLRQTERVEAEHTAVRQQIQAAEQQLIALGAGQPFAAANYQQQSSAAMNAQKNLQKDVDRLTTDVKLAEVKLKELDEKVKLFMSRHSR